MPVRRRGKKATGTLTQTNGSHPICTPSRLQQSLEMLWGALGGLQNMGLSLFAFLLNMKEERPLWTADYTRVLLRYGLGPLGSIWEATLSLGSGWIQRPHKLWCPESSRSLWIFSTQKSQVLVKYQILVFLLLLLLL